MSVQVSDIIAAIVDVEKTSADLKGLAIKQVPPNAPEQVSQFPAIVNIPEEATRVWPSGSNVRQVEHKVQATLMLALGDSPSADMAAKRYITPMFDAFDHAATLGGIVTAAGVTEYKYGKVKYGGVEYSAIQFTLTVLVKERVVYSP